LNIHSRVPWWLKIILKILLSRLNVSYKVWQKIGIFRHGLMDEPEYAYNTFLKHYKSADFDKKDDDFIMLELGPGDSMASGVIAQCFGAQQSFLVDKGNDAFGSFDKYDVLLDYLAQKHNKLRIKDKQVCIDNLESEWHIIYLTDGLDSLKSIPDGSIDYLWTQSVLEHIRKAEFHDYIEQFRRIVSENGVCVHGVDLKDHLAYAHHNLRFSEKIWESDFMSSSGFYTNRILFTEMTDIFKSYNFDIEVLNISRWKDIPTSRAKLDSIFQSLSDKELSIADFDIVLRPV
jgi:hypothetical protein